ncbi:MAG: ROK family protein [Eubacteriales bacterium]|nr:ROK family protein [Eubacteriales bacterium]
MDFLNVKFCIRNIPGLDPDFIPPALFNRAFLKTARKKIAVAFERPEDRIAVRETFIHGTPDMHEADAYYIGRLVKTYLWVKGGYRVFICGDRKIYEEIRKAYLPGGGRAFDSKFMSGVYERQFEVVYRDYDERPLSSEISNPLGGHLDGCRIGFDAGGSDRKVSAVVDGEVIHSEEVIWHPKLNPDPDYHFREIVAAFRSAALHMPRVDAIGISSAGIYIGNRTMVASLFLKVPQKLFDEKVKDIYIRAAREIADVPVVVCNDGDVSALAGGMSLNTNNILGIAMGTSQAGGFLDEKGNITGWLNELAFVPIDFQPGAPADEWSGDIGCGVKYFSQDAVIRLAAKAGIAIDEKLTPAEKLKYMQDIFTGTDTDIDVAEKSSQGNKEAATAIFSSIGVYLGHSAAAYFDIYRCGTILLLGRVMSGRGGELILKNACDVIADEYPEMKGRIKLILPDEKSRRVGQSVAAASLPEIGGKK